MIILAACFLRFIAIPVHYALCTESAADALGWGWVWGGGLGLGGGVGGLGGSGCSLCCNVHLYRRVLTKRKTPPTPLNWFPPLRLRYTLWHYAIGDGRTVLSWYMSAFTNNAIFLKRIVIKKYRVLTNPSNLQHLSNDLHPMHIKQHLKILDHGILQKCPKLKSSRRWHIVFHNTVLVTFGFFRRSLDVFAWQCFLCILSLQIIMFSCIKCLVTIYRLTSKQGRVK